MAVKTASGLPHDSTRGPTAKGSRPSYLRTFLQTPLAWLLLLILATSVAAEAQYREGNRRACAAVSMLLERQIFRDIIARPGSSEVRVLQFCLDFATPITYETKHNPPLSRTIRFSK